MFKILNYEYPQYITDLFRRTGELTHNNLNGCDTEAVQPLAKAKHLKESFAYWEGKNWNN